MSVISEQDIPRNAEPLDCPNCSDTNAQNWQIKADNISIYLICRNPACGWAFRLTSRNAEEHVLGAFYGES